MPDRPPVGRTNRPIDRDALARLYDAHAAGLFRYALVVLMDHALAEDAVQQVFAKLLATAGGLPESPAHYLRRAVRNECLTARERRAREPAAIDRPVLEAAASEPADPEKRLAIEAALRALPIEQREVVVLKVYEGLTFKEIAEFTDTPPNTVASRYRYAIEKMRAALQLPGCST